MSVAHLSDQNFVSANGGRVLQLNNIPGLSIVMFKTEGCGHCRTFTSKFQNVAKQELRVRHFFASVDKYRRIVGMAQTTNTPVRAVPMFVFYVNGLPKAKYNGNQTEEALLAFLNKMVAQFSSEVQQPFVSKNSPQGMQYPAHRGGAPSRGPIPTRGMASARAMNSQTLGIGLSQRELEKRHQEMDVGVVPQGIIPHNAPWTNYRTMDLSYDQSA